MTTTAFAAYIRRAATAAGYDLTGPRSGGRLALAQAAGMSHASVCRMLAGKTTPDARFFEPLARALDVPLLRLFEHAGLIPEGTPRLQDALPSPLTPAQAAARLGIRSPDKVALFVALTAVLQGQDGAGS